MEAWEERYGIFKISQDGSPTWMLWANSLAEGREKLKALSRCNPESECFLYDVLNGRRVENWEA